MLLACKLHDALLLALLWHCAAGAQITIEPGGAITLGSGGASAPGDSCCAVNDSGDIEITPTAGQRVLINGVDFGDLVARVAALEALVPSPPASPPPASPPPPPPPPPPAVSFRLGGTISSYPGYGCFGGNNDETINDVDLAGCQAACVAVLEGRCRSIDFYVGRTGHTCSISHSAASHSSHFSSTSDCRYYQRIG